MAADRETKAGSDSQGIDPEVAALLQSNHQIRWVYKDFPVLGANSVMEAKALVAAKNMAIVARLSLVCETIANHLELIIFIILCLLF